MSDFFYTIFFILFFLLELLYFRIATNSQIVDKPNERSSHTHLTILGGGIIFPVSVVSWFILSNYQSPLFISGLLLISGISFLDDLKNLGSRTRFFFHFVAVVLLIFEMSLRFTWFWYIPVVILIIGFINAYNFMDGINGITGTYSLVTIGTLLYVNRFIQQFTSEALLIFIILSLLVFNFFNFRRNAKCFAGDVGSISLAFIITYLLMGLISSTNSILFVGILLLYGLDTVTTIIFRIFRKENIFHAHRTHFYQFLCNERRWTHLSVAALYSFGQLLVNVVILFLFSQGATLYSDVFLLLTVVFIGGILFTILRLRLEGGKRLLGSIQG